MVSAVDDNVGTLPAAEPELWAPPIQPVVRRVMRMGARDLLVVAGLPGSGKSTLLRRLRVRGRAAVLDPERVAARLARLAGPLPYRVYRPLVHSVHWAHVTLMLLFSRHAVVVHATGTRSFQNLLLRVLAALTRRPCRLMWLAVDPARAYAATLARGRPHGRREFRGQVRRATRTMRRWLRTRNSGVMVVDRRWTRAGLVLVVEPQRQPRLPLSG